jgi:hypothetical protein
LLVRILRQCMHVIERQYFISTTSSAISPVFGASLNYGELPDMTLYARSPFLYFRICCWYCIVTITTTGYAFCARGLYVCIPSFAQSSTDRASDPTRMCRSLCCFPNSVYMGALDRQAEIAFTVCPCVCVSVCLCVGVRGGFGRAVQLRGLLPRVASRSVLGSRRHDLRGHSHIAPHRGCGRALDSDAVRGV